MAVSIRWSLGNIITATELIWDIACALRECGGSAENYGKTDRWLNSLGDILLWMQDNPSRAEEEVINRLQAAVSKFKEALSTEFNVSLGPDRNPRWWHGIKRKIEFRMFAQKEIEILQAEVEEPLNTISRHLGMDAIELAQYTYATTRDLLQALKKKDQEQRELKRSQILKWLNPVLETENIFNARMKGNVDGTGQWLQETEKYQSWLATPIGDDTEKSLLWIVGIPGAGKTSLATSVVQTLKNTKKAKTYKVAFFYCDGRLDETQSENAILRTWLWQLMLQCNCDLKELDRAWMWEPKPSNSTLKTSLISLLKDTSEEVVFILDGLDELVAWERHAFVQRELSVLKQHAHCLVLSRLANDSEWTFRKPIPDHEYQHIRIQPENIADDLRKFSLREIDNIVGRDDGMRTALMQAFERRPEGMFQWVALVIGALNEAIWDEYLDVVQEAPMELNSLYCQILSGIWNRLQPTARDKSKRIFQWLTYAMRPLTLLEVDAFLKVGMENPPTHVLTVPEVLNMCGALVNVSSDTTVPVLTLAHMSTKEFLVEAAWLDDLFKDLVMEETEIHAFIGRTCLAYLCNDNFGMVPFRPAKFKQHAVRLNRAPREPYEKAVDDYLDTLPLQRYAAVYWPRHIFDSIWDTRTMLPPETGAALLRLCRSDKSTIRWLLTCQREIGDRGSFRSNKSWQDDTKFLVPIGKQISAEGTENKAAYAAWLAHLTGDWELHGFSRWGRYLSSSNANDFLSDVHTAAHFDFVDYLRAFLDSGGDPNITTLTSQRPLHFAGRGESVESAKLLLERGADANALGWRLHRPLSWAVDHEEFMSNRHMGPFEVAELLLDAGADAFAPAYRPPILRAFMVATASQSQVQRDSDMKLTEDEWHVALVRKMLGSNTKETLAKMASVGIGVMDLHYFASKDAIDIMNCFIKLGIDINTRDTADRTPLDAALQTNSRKCADRLRSLGGRTSAELRAIEEANRETEPEYWPQTAGNIFDAYLVLRRMFMASQFPPKPVLTTGSSLSMRMLIMRILDTARYWLKMTSSKQDTQVYSSSRCDKNPVYLRTAPIVGRQLRPICEIHFYICGHDQGCSSYPSLHGTFEQSWTWYEFDVYTLTATKEEKRRNDSAIQLARNLHAIKQTSHYQRCMKRNLDCTTREDTWMEQVRAGDRIAVIARALYPGWQNYVESVKVTVYTTCLLE